MDLKNYSTGVQHIGIPTNDIDKTVEFYHKLGFETAFETVNEEANEKVVFLKLGTLVVETYENHAAKMEHGAIDHVALDVKDIEEIFQYINEAYLAALPDGVAPRILASRTAFVADSHAHALQVAEPGLRKQATQHRAAGHTIEGDSVTDYLQQLDAHVGDPEHVIASLAQDSVLARATDISFQVHSVEPSHRDTLRSIELIAQHIAPHIR